MRPTMYNDVCGSLTDFRGVLCRYILHLESTVNGNYKFIFFSGLSIN